MKKTGRVLLIIFTFLAVFAAGFFTGQNTPKINIVSTDGSVAEAISGILFRLQSSQSDSAQASGEEAESGQSGSQQVSAEASGLDQSARESVNEKERENARSDAGNTLEEDETAENEIRSYEEITDEDAEERNSKILENDPEDYNESKDPEEYLIEGVPHIYQAEAYPTGCESVSTVCALQYMGQEISVDEFIDNYLPMAEYSEDEEGNLLGPDPDKAFLGNPYEEGGTGCYPGALLTALSEIELPEDYAYIDLTGTSMKELCENYIANDIPVVFWATGGMEPQTDYMYWTDEDTGEEVDFPLNEHCLLLIGYDEDGYYFSDPLSEEEYTYYDKEAVEQSHQLLGKRALAIYQE